MEHLKCVCACADLCTLPAHSDTLPGRRNLHWTLTLPVNILIIKSQLLGTRCPLQTLILQFSSPLNIPVLNYHGYFYLEVSEVCNLGIHEGHHLVQGISS